MANEIKTIFFDSDGVLAHTEELFFEANKKIFTEIGIDYTRETFGNHTFKTNLGTSGFMQNLGFGSEEIKAFRARRNILWQKKVTTTDVVDKGAEDVFNNLKSENYRLGIVTNTNEENFRKTYHSSKIPTLADFIVTREQYDLGKPNPDSYLTALKVAEANKLNTVVVEDSPRGIESAKSAGLRVIAIPNPVIKDLDISSADYQITSLIELLPLVRSL